MKATDVQKPMKVGQAGGLACKAKYGNNFYRNIAKKAHQDRKKLLTSFKHK